MSKNNVHPDHYKVDGRDRQDDAAAARFARAVAAKAASRERPDRMTKGPYFQRPEPAAPASAGRTAKPARKKSFSGAVTAKKSGARKASAPRRAASPKAASNRASNSSRGKKSGIAAARPTKKR
jgi:hypothetical protein